MSVLCAYSLSDAKMNKKSLTNAPATQPETHEITVAANYMINNPIAEINETTQHDTMPGMLR
jgi:hypothetical protein